MSKQQKVKLGTAKQRADHRANVAIKKELLDVKGNLTRTVFLGRERNRRSRKYREKLFTPKPVDLTALVKEQNEKTKQDTETHENR